MLQLQGMMQFEIGFQAWDCWWLLPNILTGWLRHYRRSPVPCKFPTSSVAPRPSSRQFTTRTSQSGARLLSDQAVIRFRGIPCGFDAPEFHRYSIRDRWFLRFFGGMAANGLVRTLDGRRRVGFLHFGRQELDGRPCTAPNTQKGEEIRGGDKRCQGFYTQVEGRFLGLTWCLRQYQG
jgi:hypothetical protein